MLDIKTGIAMRPRRLILPLLLLACTITAYSSWRTALWHRSQRAAVYAAAVQYVARQWYPGEVYWVCFWNAGPVGPQLKRKVCDLTTRQVPHLLIRAQGSVALVGPGGCMASHDGYWVYEGRRAVIVELGQIHWRFFTAAVDVMGTCGPQCGTGGSLTAHRVGQGWVVSSYAPGASI